MKSLRIASGHSGVTLIHQSNMKTPADHYPSLLRFIFAYRWQFRVLIVAIALIAALLGIFTPYAQKHFIESLVASDQNLYLWLLSAFLAAFFAAGASNLVTVLANKEAILTQKVLSEKMYLRAIEGQGGLIGNKSPGEGVSLFAVDVPGAVAVFDQVFIMAVSLVFPIVIAPVAVQYWFGIPWEKMALSMLALCSISGALAIRQSKFFVGFKTMAGERTAAVADWILNIRSLRILGWMPFMEKRILGIRERETRNRIQMVTNGQALNSVATTSTYVLNILAVVFLLAETNRIGSQVTAGDALGLMWVMNVFLMRPIRMLPWTIVIGIDAFTSLRRLQNALNLEIKTARVLENVDTQAAHLNPSYNEIIEERRLAAVELTVTDLNLIIDGESLLKKIDLKIESGEFVCVVGEVGAGKSLLLKSLVGLVPATFGKFEINGMNTNGPQDPTVRQQFAYVPQESYAMSASLAENVVFDFFEENVDNTNRKNEFLTTKASGSLLAAQFDCEVENMQSGLLTQIGERGVNLSGGQKQRVSLAKAHFSGRNFILMDDSLSAVDNQVELELIKTLILHEWKNKTILMTTHRMSILPHCDRILFLKDGKVFANGSYDVLMQNSEFRHFVSKSEKPPQGVTPHA